MTESDPNNQPQYSPTIIQRAGDYAVQIAQNFGKVVIERTIYVFKDVKQVITFFLILIGVGAVIAFGYWYSRQPRMMTGDFNIAVSKFVEVSNSSNIDVAESAGQLIYGYVDDEYKLSSFEDVQVNYYHKIEPVEGSEDAKALMEKTNAHLVIYGNVTVINNEAVIKPKFFVTEAFQFDVLSGQHEMELPVLFSVDELLDEDSDLNILLPKRMAILTEFTKGLVYFAADDLVLSSQAMENAIDYVNEYGRFSGAEVIYVLASNNARLQEEYDLSQDYVDNAFALNSDYGRAYIAQGNIYYDQLDFYTAATYYQQAVELDEQPFGAYIVEKASLNLGNIYTYQYQETIRNPEAHQNEKDQLAQAGLESYQVVIDSHNNLPHPEARLKDLAAWSYYGSGVIYQVQGKFEEAAEAFEQALTLTKDSDLVERATRRRNEVQPGVIQ